MTHQPSESEKHSLSRIIPDEPGTVAFDVERTIITWPDGSETLITEGVVDWEPKGTVRRERRTVTVTNTAWAVIEPKPVVCAAFVWIGQSWKYCDECGQPYWEHTHEWRASLPPEPIDPEIAASVKKGWG